MDFIANVSTAYGRIKDRVRKTPLEYSPFLSRKISGGVHLKWESRQVTGSFKIRGALNTLMSLSEDQREKGVVAASTGNHGAGLAHACMLEGVDLLLFVPRSTARSKVEKLRSYGLELKIHGGNCSDAEQFARKTALDTGRVYVSPYNGHEIICGQGTVGLEISMDFPNFDDVIVPVGGGGLISGIGRYLKHMVRKREIRIFGVEPYNSRFMSASVAAGRIVDIEETATVADALAGGIEPGSITFPLCRDFVDDFFIIGEEEIKTAMAMIHDHFGKMVEGAGALPLAGLLKEKDRFFGKNVILVISGGNIAPEDFREAVRGIVTL